MLMAILALVPRVCIIGHFLPVLLRRLAHDAFLLALVLGLAGDFLGAFRVHVDGGYAFDFGLG